MSLYKLNEIWYVDLRHEGQRVRRTTGTGNKQQAKEYHDKLKSELWRAEKFNEPLTHTFSQVAERFLLENAGRKGIRHDAEMLEWILPRLQDVAVADINDATIAALTSERQAQKVGSKMQRATAPGTVNRHMAILAKLLRRAQSWGWIKSIPKFRKLKEPRDRVRFLMGDETARLLSALPHPWNVCARFTLATGLRETCCTHLEWDRVNTRLKMAWMRPEDIKNEVPLNVPLNKDALAILEEQDGKHPRWVFPREDGEPIKKASCTTWYGALRRAKIKNFRWHDLRHTWASWHVMAGTPLEVLQKLGGWQKLDMVMRYAHLTPSYIAGFAGNVRAPDLAPVSELTDTKKTQAT